VLSPDALERLLAHAWPGNVRELENAIKRALVLGSGEVLTREAFAFLIPPAAAEGPPAEAGLDELVLREVDAALASGARDLHESLLRRIERPLLERVLAHTGGNQLRAAALLGINRNTLRKKLAELGIEVPAR
jgi:two-component system nitrogen regulation response regulator GlnG